MIGAAATRVLVVEDQKLIAADLENTLEKLGYDVIGSAASGEDAVRDAEDLRPDLVLMDIRLRGAMDGIQAATLIRERQDIPIIYLTAYADEQTILRAKITAPFGYVVKPFNERELRAAIEIALYKHETERLLADERARRHALEEFKLLIDSVKDYAIVMLDTKGRITSWNAGAERIKGYHRDQILGRHFSVFYPPELVANGTPPQVLERAAREERVEQEGWRIRGDGSAFWANVVITPLRDSDGRLRGFAKVTRDMTERRRMEEAEHLAREEAEHANRLKDEFLATVSHELRTPLNVIMGELWRLQSGTLTPEMARRALDALQRNTTVQARLIEDLLDTSAVATGRMRIALRPVDLGRVVDAAVETISPAAAAKHIDVRVSPGPAEIISGDRDRLQQIFWNLLSNAVKFTESGGRVDVQLQRVGTQVEVRVTDTGIGINPNFLPKLFQRFSQADTSSTRVHTGFGLGLALSRYLVEAHGGELAAHSAGPGRGSTFSVRFPVPAVVEVPAPTGQDIRLDGIQVLLVDDQADALQSVGAILRMFGADVICATSVSEAMTAFDNGRPQVVLADIAMPGEDGYDLIRRIRGSTRPELRGVAAAALTAYSSREDRSRVLSAGYHLHLAKPMNPADLAAAVSQLATHMSGAAQSPETTENS
jgi:PAS domain S-box-containing protein